jgi:hypothetical protein
MRTRRLVGGAIALLSAWIVSAEAFTPEQIRELSGLPDNRAGIHPALRFYPVATE